MSTDELLAEALRLTRVDRARVAEELLSSLEESDEEVAAAWATELERRSRDVAEGRVDDQLGDRADRDLEGARATACVSNCILKRVPSFAAQPPWLPRQSDGRDWAKPAFRWCNDPFCRPPSAALSKPEPPPLPPAAQRVLEKAEKAFA